MPGDAIPMRQTGEAFAEQAACSRQPYLSRLFGRAWGLATRSRRRSHRDDQPDGLEAFDLLGGWQGTDARR